MVSQREINKIYLILITIMFFKIAGFFTITENVAITRVMKIFIRVVMTAWIIQQFANSKEKYGVASFTYTNKPALFFYILYFILGFYSLLWTSDVLVTSLQLVMDIELLIFSYIFIQYIVFINYKTENKIRLSRILAFSIWLILMVMIIGKSVAPDKFFRLTHGGDVARLGGFMMNPNELGMLSVIGAAMCYVELKKTRHKFIIIIMILFLVYGLVLTQSRSSMIGFLLITFLFVRKSKNKLIQIGMYSGMIAAIPVIINTIFIKMGDLDEVLSMTGRLPFWKALLTEALPQQPFRGFGFMRIYYTDYFAGVHTYAAKMTHNTFVQVLLNLGLIGFSIVLIQMFFTLRAHIVSKDEDKRLVFMGVFIPAIINSFTEFGIFGETNFGILFYQLIIFLYVVNYNPHYTFQEQIINSIIQSKKQIKNSKL